VNDGSQTTELEISTNLAQESNPNLPTKISAQFEDGAGNITFRLSPAPDDLYVLTVMTQSAAGNFTAATQTFSPVPDYLMFMVNTGFQAKTYEYLADPRFIPTLQLFLQQVVAANTGLSETAKNIFLSDRLMTQREELGVQQGRR
jgi:hypothetical protein